MLPPASLSNSRPPLVRQINPRNPATLVLATLLGLTAVTDLVRCGIGLTRIGGPTETMLLFISGGVAALGSLITAGGAVRRRRWALWSAALLGVAAAPQASMTGFRAPYTIPDVATAILGILLTATVLVGSQRDSASSAPSDPSRVPASRPAVSGD